MPAAVPFRRSVPMESSYCRRRGLKPHIEVFEHFPGSSRSFHTFLPGSLPGKPLNRSPSGSPVAGHHVHMCTRARSHRGNILVVKDSRSGGGRTGNHPMPVSTSQSQPPSGWIAVLTLTLLSVLMGMSPLSVHESLAVENG